MPLTPEAIYEDYMNKDLDKTFAVQLLLTLIDNAEKIDSRLESIKILDKIQVNDEETFKHLENLLISDLNDDIRNLTTIIIKNNYLEKALAPMVWALEHETSLKCLITVISTIGEINTRESKEVLIAKLRNLKKKEYDKILQELLKKKIQNSSSKELAEILANFYVISFLKITFGYFKFKTDNFGLVSELDLSNIERYSSSQNKLEWFLESIFSLHHLTICDLRFNHLTKIPGNIHNSIKNLDLSYNKIGKLFDLSSFNLITSLNLKSNRLRSLPESLGFLISLEKLNLRNNVLSNLPQSLNSISSLKILDLHGNKFSSIDINLNKSLLELELGWNNLRFIPKSLEALSSLEKLGLGGNKLTELPEWLGSYPSLKQLDLYDNKLTKIPESLGFLTSLEKLNLRNNEIENLPSTFKNLKSLKILNLSWNNFTSLPEWIGKLSSLEELNLWGNLIEILPESLGALSSLKILDLNFNKLEDSPPFLKEMERRNGLIIKL